MVLGAQTLVRAKIFKFYGTMEESRDEIGGLVAVIAPVKQGRNGPLPADIHEEHSKLRLEADPSGASTLSSVKPKTGTELEIVIKKVHTKIQKNKKIQKYKKIKNLIKSKKNRKIIENTKK